MKNLKRCIAFGFALATTVSTAQTVTKQQAISDINTLLPSNTVSLITAEKIRQSFSKTLNYAESNLTLKPGAFSLSQVRAFTADLATANPRIMLTNAGKEGVFYRDAADSVTVDNTGTVIVTSGGARYKRVFDGYVLPHWFGDGVGDGVTNNTTVLKAACALQRQVFLKKGAYLVNGEIPLHNNILFEKGAIVKVMSGYSGTVFSVKSKKHLDLKNIYIDAEAPLVSCIGLKIQGLWNSSIDNFSFLAHAADSSSVGIDIVSSEAGNLGYGTYVITLHNPYINRGFAGIRTKKAAGDGVGITHLNISGGWILAQKNANLHLSDAYNFSIHNTAFDVINTVGIKLADNCHEGELYIGEYNSGRLLDISANSSFINLKSNQNLNLAAAVKPGGANYAAQTPSLLRLTATHDTLYYTEIRSHYQYGNPFEIVGNFGTAEHRILGYQVDKGLMPKLVSSNNAAGNTLIGINADGGLTKLSHSNYSEGTAAPATGTWAVGDYRKNTAPVAGGYSGWECLSAGTPGVWKGVGLIEN
jgi:hypothetical protein